MGRPILRQELIGRATPGVDVFDIWCSNFVHQMPEVAVVELSTGPESVHIGVEAVVFEPRSFQAWWVGRVSTWWNGEVLMRWGSGTVVEEDPDPWKPFSRPLADQLA